MITDEQLELSRKLFEQARDAAAIAHQSWAQLIQSQKSLLKSFREAGFPFSEATQQFETMMEFHSDAYKSALKHMDEMNQQYGEILKRFRHERGT